MPVENDIERTVLLADFGQTVTYTRTGGSPVAIVGIFDNAYEDISAGGSVSFAVQQPRLLCKTSDVASAAEGDTFVIGGVTYKVTVVMADGIGMTEFMLEKQ